MLHSAAHFLPRWTISPVTSSVHDEHCPPRQGDASRDQQNLSIFGKSRSLRKKREKNICKSRLHVCHSDATCLPGVKIKALCFERLASVNRCAVERTRVPLELEYAGTRVSPVGYQAKVKFHSARFIRFANDTGTPIKNPTSHMRLPACDQTTSWSRHGIPDVLLNPL